MKKNLLLGMAAFLMAGLASCNNEDLILGPQDNQDDVEKTYFVNINIATTEAMTRGGEQGPYNGEWDPSEEPNFDRGEKYGDSDENAVKTIFLIFYDKSHKRVYTTQVRKDNDNPGTPSTKPNENSLYSGIVQVDVKHGSEKPAYVMCFINPITSQSFEMNPEFETLESLEETTRGRIIDDNGFFAMSKSVYFGVDRSETDDQGKPLEDKPENYKKLIATPIPDGSFFDTYKEAEDAINDYNKQPGDKTDPVLDIYVERYAAKVKLSFANNCDYVIKDTQGNLVTFGDQNLKFVPEYWAVNAYESDTYICKSFKDEKGMENLSYLAMNTALGGDVNSYAMPWFWNSPAHHRSYWAQTPGYYKQAYPRVADDLLDHAAGNSVIGNDKDYALGYYSYNDLVKNSSDYPGMPIIRKARNLAASNGVDREWPIYARENTVAGSALREAARSDYASAKAAVASIVLVGHYEIGSGNNYEKVNDTFWIMGNSTNGYTFFKNNKEVIRYLMNTAVHFADADKQEIYKYGLSGYDFKDNAADYKDLFIMQHPTYDTRSKAPGNSPIILDSRFETVQIDKDAFSKRPSNAPVLYAQMNNEWVEVTMSNIDEINLQMLYQAGTAQGYEGGKAYFNIPIQHLGYYRTDNPNKQLTANDKKFDWTKVKSGDFGLVRNHVYNIEIQKINGLGNGIPHPDVPIVPPTDPEEYYIGARIIVLNWAIVPTQRVTL